MACEPLTSPLDDFASLKRRTAKGQRLMTTRVNIPTGEPGSIPNAEPFEALQRFGYDQNEARFLCIAALQSGYFLRRQYLKFLRATKGSKDAALVGKLQRNGHCRVLVFRQSRMVYHIYAKPLYDALGDPDNRNRREHQPMTIKNRIMALDFMLAHPTYRYLVTQREKRDYFTGDRQIPAEDLPTRWYESPRGAPASSRHFADKYPIFLVCGPAETDQTVHFCYVDEGTQDIDRFATYLRQYSRLFTALSDSRVIYVAQNDRLFAKARRAFDELTNPKPQKNGATDQPSRELIEYFEMRREYEAKDFSRFDTARLIRYREAKQRFMGTDFEALYNTWLATGNAAFVGNRDAERDKKEARLPQFSTYILDHDYDLFGTLTTPKVWGTVAADAGTRC